MREILFKGKRIDNNEWVYGNYIHTKKKDYIYKKNVLKYEVIPETVGQFTGLKDKNDKKIFEGDIIQLGERIADVRWNGETLSWELTNIGVPDYEVNHLYNTLPLSEIMVEICYIGEITSEIIGNIHDNFSGILKRKEMSK